MQEEGIRGLFKGLAPHLIGVTPSRYVQQIEKSLYMPSCELSTVLEVSRYNDLICANFDPRAIYFSVYAKVKRNLKTSQFVHKDSLIIPLFAGAAAGRCDLI